jgi:hypothetical protein
MRMGVSGQLTKQTAAGVRSCVNSVRQQPTCGDSGSPCASRRSQLSRQDIYSSRAAHIGRAWATMKACMHRVKPQSTVPVNSASISHIHKAPRVLLSCCQGSSRRLQACQTSCSRPSSSIGSGSSSCRRGCTTSLGSSSRVGASAQRYTQAPLNSDLQCHSKHLSQQSWLMPMYLLTWQQRQMHASFAASLRR